MTGMQYYQLSSACSTPCLLPLLLVVCSSAQSSSISIHRSRLFLLLLVLLESSLKILYSFYYPAPAPLQIFIVRTRCKNSRSFTQASRQTVTCAAAPERSRNWKEQRTHARQNVILCATLDSFTLLSLMKRMLLEEQKEDECENGDSGMVALKEINLRFNRRGRRRRRGASQVNIVSASKRRYTWRLLFQTG